jgi:hypothetical protein
MPANKPTRRSVTASAALARREGAAPPDRRPAEAELAGTIPLLVVVSGSDATFWKFVKAAFAGSESVRVILDRRSGDRRRGARGVGANRRNGERRDRLLIGEQLRAHGWALVHRPPRS